MRIVIADEHLARSCSTVSEAQRRLSGELLVAYMDGIRDSEKAFDEAAVQLVTCDECVFAYQFHHALHCKKLRKASEPLTDMMVERTGYCSEGRMK